MSKFYVPIITKQIFKAKSIIKSSHSNKRFSIGNDPVLITPLDEATRFMRDSLVAVGSPNDTASVVAHNLVTADHRGYFSHGMNRLQNYVKDIQQGKANPKAAPVVVKETAAIALVDGSNAMGAIIGSFCMDLAIKKALDVGIGFVAAKNCNHYGLASIYPLQAMEKGLIGFSVTNTSPLMAPIRAKQAALGTNPISLGANGKNGDSFVLDAATTAVSLGKIELYKRKGLKIPPTWALNDQGKPETDAAIAHKAAKLMPLGGTEANSGYKGYGFGILVEVLSGILAGANYGPHIRKWGRETGGPPKPANLGTAYMAIDPKAFGPQFEERLQDLINHLRKMEPVDPSRPVLVPGDAERNHVAQVKKEGGLRYVKNQHDTNKKLAAELKVEPPRSFQLKS